MTFQPYLWCTWDTIIYSINKCICELKAVILLQCNSKMLPDIMNTTLLVCHTLMPESHHYAEYRTYIGDLLVTDHNVNNPKSRPKPKVEILPS